MKFISKNSNLNIILRPGQQAQPITGTPAIPALSVRFQNGLAEINDESLVEMMLRHPAFNQDFISVEEQAADPYAHMREGSEPQHVTTEMQFGHPVSRSVSPTMKVMPPEIKKLITEEATLIANELVKNQLPALVAEALKSLAPQAAPAAPVAEVPAEEAAAATEEAAAAPAKPKPRNK